jgi:streptogramin lyase
MKSDYTNLLLAVLLSIIVTSCITPPFVLVDGGASATAFVYFDENGNGIFEKGERPLSRVKVGGQSYTDETGNASVFYFSPGCASKCWEGWSISVETPQGYKPSTPTQFQLIGDNQTYQFGFTLDPASVTATPYSSRLSCKIYGGVSGEDSGVSSDGSLWFAIPDGVAKYDSRSDLFQLNNNLSGLYDDIFTGDNNEIWITSQESNISRYLNSEWQTYGEESLITSSDISLGKTSDGRIWFARQAPPDSLISFNVETGKWQYFTYPSNSKYVVGQHVRVSTDGSAWFAAFDYRADKQIPDSSKSIQWKIFDIHSFTADEIVVIPDLYWINDSKLVADGTIWLTTTNGLAHFEPSTNKWDIYDWPISPEGNIIYGGDTISVGPDGLVWIGGSYYQKPLALRFVPKSGEWFAYDDRDGIPDIETIDNISVTPDGKVWFGFGLAHDIVAGCLVLK